MKTWKIITMATLAVVAAALLISTVAAMGPIGYNPNTGYAGYGGFGGMMGGYGGGGMMGGYGYGYGYGYPTQPGIAASSTPNSQYYQPVYPYQYGGGCMGAGFGYGYTAAPYTYSGAQLNITTAAQIGENYVASLGNPNLAVKEVEEYSQNFYIQVYEKNTGIGAFELLVNKYTGSIYPEMGPNMMWNTKYGMMRSGILGGIYGAPTTSLPVNASQATVNAQQYLTSYLPGTTTGDVTTFYGYYTIEVLNGTTPFGMLSVNGYTGQVWYHTWHGTFIQELDL